MSKKEVMMITEFVLKEFPEVIVKVCENELFQDSDFKGVCGNDSIEFAIQIKYANNKTIVDAVFEEFKNRYPPTY
jgi:hypothetical protein